MDVRCLLFVFRKIVDSPSLSGNIAPRKIAGRYIREVRMFSISFKIIRLPISTFYLLISSCIDPLLLTCCNTLNLNHYA